MENKLFNIFFHIKTSYERVCYEKVDCYKHNYPFNKLDLIICMNKIQEILIGNIILFSLLVCVCVCVSFIPQ